MGIVIKSSLRFSAILYIGIALGFLNTILIFPNILTEEEFGLTRILMSASSVISQFALLGTGNILVRFHPHFKNDQKNTTLSLGIIISVIGLILAALFLFIFKPVIVDEYKENSKLFTDFYYLILPFVISLVFFSLFDGYLRVILKNSVPAFLNYILLRLLWLSLVLIYSSGNLSLTSFISLYVACQALVALIALFYIVFLGKLNVSFSFNHEKIKLIRHLMSFGLFTIISGISIYLINRIDILMVGKYIGLEQVAVYTIAFYMSTVIIVPAQSIGRASHVLVSDAFKNNQLNIVADLYKKTALNQLLLGGLVFILILLNYHNIIVFLPELYRESFMVFFFLGLAKLVDTSFGLNGSIILNSEYYKYDTYLSILLLIFTVATNLLLIPIYGIVGASVATAISVIVFNILKFLVVKYKLSMTPFSKNYGVGVLILICTLIIPYFIPKFDIVLLDIIFRSTIVILIFIPAIYYLNISPEINSIIKAILSRIGFKA